MDLAPTLALLLGLPIPRSSVGRVLLPALSPLSQTEQLKAMYANANQLREAYDAECGDHTDERDRFRERYLQTRGAYFSIRSRSHPSSYISLTVSSLCSFY